VLKIIERELTLEVSTAANQLKTKARLQTASAAAVILSPADSDESDDSIPPSSPGATRVSAPAPPQVAPVATVAAPAAVTVPAAPSVPPAAVVPAPPASNPGWVRQFVTWIGTCTADLKNYICSILDTVYSSVCSWIRSAYELVPKILVIGGFILLSVGGYLGARAFSCYPLFTS